jgi:Zn-dependent M16 (insulinase) family peptidase
MLKTVLDAVGQTYKNFLITKYLPLPELQSTLIELVHEPSGAKVLHIANDDPENLFCLSFQTLPESSNGVAHILEHTVLCGSKKFPVKDPFFSMTRRSLNTYMNALTGQDFTCYPASSQVPKDFYNLLEVYMDSVFHPELKHLSFLQEGHRFEIIDHALQYQGVVYNEMKGAMSSIDSRLWEALSKRLLPDLPYAHNSGGNPKDIPHLSYQELIDFHREYYHPSRCLFFFYGNLPLGGHLDFIAKELDSTRKIAPLPPLPLQTKFESSLADVDFFPVSEEEKQQPIIAFAWLTAPISHQKEILALEVINSILTDTDASPLTMAPLKSGLCTQVESSLDAEMSEAPWVIVCKGCKAGAEDEIQKLLFDTLRSALFEKEEIEAALHQLEFERTEIGGEGGPFGLTLFMRAALLKQHGSEPENALLIHSLFKDLRDSLKDPKYLPSLLQKYVLKNPHFVRLTLKPDPHMAKKELLETTQELKAIYEKLSKKEIEEIQEQSKKLKAYQEEVEHQSIDCLPKVTLKDVPPHIRDFPLKRQGNVFHHACFTNQILYADLVFNLPEMKVEELPLLSLFAQILPEIGNARRNYEENLAYQQLYLGSLNASIALHVSVENPDVCRPTFSLRGKALYRNAEKLFELFADTMKPDFKDRARIKEWISQHATEQKDRLNRAAMGFATQNALKGLAIPAFIQEKWSGLSYYKSVLEWEKHFDPTLLEQMGEKILGLADHEWVFSCDEAQFEKVEKLSKIDLPNKAYKPWQGHYALPKPEPSASFIAAPVAFTASGLRTISYREEEAPELLIASELMKNVVLHKEIREKGGAYGSGAVYNSSTGTFHFFAYRDPHLKNSLDAFQKALEKIGGMEFKERELEEAKLGVLQSLDAPVAPGNRAILAYSWARAGRTALLREKFRTHVLKATPGSVASAVSAHLNGKERIISSFLGKDLFEKEEKKLNKPLKVLPI